MTKRLNLDHVILMPDRKTAMTYQNSAVPLTMGMMISEAAIGMYSNENPQPDGREKAARFAVSVKAGMGGEQDFTSQELDRIVSVCDLKCGTWIYGQVLAWVRCEEPFAVAKMTEADQPVKASEPKAA